jgi:acetyl esterase/lipase
MNKLFPFTLLHLTISFLLVLTACGTTPQTETAAPTLDLPSATLEPTQEMDTMNAPTPRPTRAVEGGIVYSIPGMELIPPTHTDISYSADNENFKLDVYAPSGLAPDTRLPAVVFVHGGASAQRNLKEHPQYVSWGKLMAASGLIAVTFNWEAPEPSGVEQAIAYVHEHAAEFQIDGERLCIFAVSAGVSAGFTVALQEMRPYLRCLVGYYGNPSRALEWITSQDASQLPPILLVKAAQDDPTLIAGTDRFASELTSRDVPVTVLLHENGEHAFDIRDNDDRSREIIEQTLEFIKRSLLE